MQKLPINTMYNNFSNTVIINTDIVIYLTHFRSNFCMSVHMLSYIGLYFVYFVL